MTIVTSGAANGDFVAPDGGWGWVVVISSLLIHLVMDGITYSLGTYLTVFTENFGVSHGEASIVHSLLPAVTLMSGPIASLFTNKYGCRWTTIIGTLIATFGFILCFFVERFFYFYITIGVVVGVGFGLIYVPAIVSVGYYFDKKRSFATGIAVCGSGIGTFVLSPINRLLFDEYGVNGAFLVTAGFVFNLVACGFLIRPISIEPSEIKKRQRLSQAIESVVVDANATKRPLIYKGPAAAAVNSQHSSPLNNPKILVSDENDQLVEHVTAKKITESMPLNINGEEEESAAAAATTRQNQAVNYNINYNQNNTGTKFACSLPMLNDNTTWRGGRTRTLSRNSQFKASNSAMDMMVMVRSLQNIPVVNEEAAEAAAATGRTHKHWKVRELKDGLLARVANAIDLSLLRDCVFLFFAISNFLTSLGFNTPFIYIVDQALKLNIPPARADLLLSTIGISNMVGRIVLGIVSNLNGVNRLYLYAGVITVCGVATTIEPFCATFTGLLIFSMVFGFTSGGYVSMTSVLLVDLFGLEQLTDAFGILLVFQGLAVAIGPPGVGIMYDILHSYVLPFVVTGVLLTISGLMCFLIPCFKRKEVQTA